MSKAWGGRVRRVLTSVAVLLTVCSGLAVVVGSGMAAADAPTSAGRGAMAGAPANGKCRHLTYDSLRYASNKAAPIPCGKKHNARTFRVTKVKDRLSKMSNPELVATGSVYCTPGFYRLMGKNWRDRMLTAYYFVFFFPNKAQMKQGANWIRCDLVLAKGRALADLPNNSSPAIVNRKINVATRVCISKGLATTVCSANNSWIPAGLVGIAQKKKPTPAGFQRLAEAKCPKVVGSKQFTYVYRAAEWRSGNRLMTCFRRHP